MATAIHGVPVASVTSRPSEVDPRTAAGWVKAGRALLVDVREPDEHAAERIDGARPMPLSSFDGASLRGLGAERIVLHCRGGTRSGEALRLARAQGVDGSALYSMSGGIEAWKKAGLPVERSARRAPMSVMRQTQLVIGAGVLAGAAGAYFVDPRWVFLSAFFGAGLVVAGLSGTCGLAVMLGKMPWNRGGPSRREPGGACCAPGEGKGA